MGVRVDIAGLTALDPIAGASAGAGGLPVTDDGERQAPWQPRPFQSRTEYNVSESMALMAVPADTIREIRPPFPLGHTPEIEGYDRTALTISEVLDTERWSPQQRSWMSGAVKPRKADAQEDNWSGTPRNFGGGQGAM